jgi:tetratricopeptide (TPR) repeat protein
MKTAWSATMIDSHRGISTKAACCEDNGAEGSLVSRKGGVTPMRRLTAFAIMAIISTGSAWANGAKVDVSPGEAALAESYLARAHIYAAKGDVSDATADLDQALRFDPRLAHQVTVLRQELAAGKGQGSANAASAASATPAAPDKDSKEINPGEAALAESYLNRASIYAAKGDMDEANADLDQALRFDPRLAYRIAELRKELAAGKDKASTNLAATASSIGTSPRSDSKDVNPGEVAVAESYMARAHVYADKGDISDANADLDEALRFDPRLADQVAEFRKELAAGKSDVTVKVAPSVSQPPSPVVTESARPIAPTPPVVAATAPAPVGRRVALVIGNNAYQNVAQLTNPTNDAKLIADALKQDGFAVTLADDLNHDGLIKALRAFADTADSADWAVVYYAGHGIEMAGTNYLIPVDAKLVSDRDVDFEAVPLNQVFTAIDGAHVLRMVILDACRDNPFAVSMKRTAQGRDIGRGLARIEPVRGTEVVYSAKEGTIAADGDGADGPFATELARYLTQPGIEVDKLFRLVRDDVLKDTGDRQEPFVYGSLPGHLDFYFRPN